jgi:hypothetical protein
MIACSIHRSVVATCVFLVRLGGLPSPTPCIYVCRALVEWTDPGAGLFDVYVFSLSDFKAFSISC